MRETPANALPQFLANLDVRVVVFCLKEEQLHVLLTPSPENSDANSAPAAPWNLPGGSIPTGQSLEETATECVLRLTGLREAFLEQLYTYGEVSRCPNGRLVSVVYFALLPAGAAGPAGISPERWFPVNQPPPLGFDFAEVIAYALRRLRYKLEYSAVGFQLLPEFFSLSELQNTYEIILGERLDKRNFRRRILQAGIIEETNRLRGGEGRPARLYRYRPDAVAEIRARRLFP